jgi:hypothetical protein
MVCSVKVIIWKKNFERITSTEGAGTTGLVRPGGVGLALGALRDAAQPPSGERFLRVFLPNI